MDYIVIGYLLLCVFVCGPMVLEILAWAVRPWIEALRDYFRAG